VESDNNNCSVIAFSNGFGIPYQDAYERLAKFGRKHGEGMSFTSFKSAVDMFAFEKGYIDSVYGKPDKPMTVKSLPEHHPKGLFFFEIHRHVAVMVDGQVLCWCKGLDEEVLTLAEIRCVDRNNA